MISKRSASTSSVLILFTTEGTTRVTICNKRIFYLNWKSLKTFYKLLRCQIPQQSVQHAIPRLGLCFPELSALYYFVSYHAFTSKTLLDRRILVAQTHSPSYFSVIGSYRPQHTRKQLYVASLISIIIPSQLTHQI